VGFSEFHKRLGHSAISFPKRESGNGLHCVEKDPFSFTETQKLLVKGWIKFSKLEPRIRPSLIDFLREILSTNFAFVKLPQAFLILYSQEFYEEVPFPRELSPMPEKAQDFIVEILVVVDVSD
jgi:hypothetical protein